MQKFVVTKRKRRTIIGAAVVLLVVAAFALSASDGDSLTGGDGDGSGGGRQLPDAQFAMFDGSSATFADFEGQPLVVNFWASWCPACVNELPEFQAVYERVGDEVTILGLANRDPRTRSEALAAEVGLTYPLADDPEGALFRSLDLIAMPSTLFISADGEVQEVFAGQLTGPALEERIERLRSAS